MIFLLFLLCYLLPSREIADAYQDLPCQWKSLTGSSFDLTPLTITSDKQMSYLIVDGDIPCTPETEPTYSFLWNFCADITTASYPNGICAGKTGAAIQYLDRSDGYQECEVIGHYDPLRDDTYFSILNEQDPSKGLSMKYLYGDKCPNGILRSASIEIECANTKSVVLSALEPEECQYHVTMQSMYGCPLECPITSNGLCNSHGHCAYDTVAKVPYCYCNQGYGGTSCTKIDSSADSGSSSYNAELGLLIVLLFILVILVGFVAYTVFRVTEFRKAQSSYAQLSSDSEVELRNPMF